MYTHRLCDIVEGVQFCMESVKTCCMENNDRDLKLDGE